tara:strand:+ start:661 stop:813 length:153 start_codon:yes stop_codon:yes gene_type:complete
MNREEFLEWLDTCPTHKYKATEGFQFYPSHKGNYYMTVTFRVTEGEEVEE